MSASSGMSTSSKNTSVVLWFIIVAIGLMVMPSTLRMSMRKVESPSVFFTQSS